MTRAPYGSWRSPITAEVVARGGVGLSYPFPVGDEVWWQESRPAEGGRVALVRSLHGGGHEDVTPPDFYARTLVHEYGGCAWLPHDGGALTCRYEDQRVYRIELAQEPLPITPEGPWRYADMRTLPGTHTVVAVRESHAGDGEAVNELVAFPADGSADPVVIAGGQDFYAFPRPSPDGTRLAWTSWDHPDMPWDSTVLWVADVAAGGTLSGETVLAGGPEESIWQPEWSPDGVLHYVSDRTDWWNLYSEGDDAPLVAMDAEFGAPQWVLGDATYAFLENGAVVAAYVQSGRWNLGVIEQGSLRDLGLPYSAFGWNPALRASGGRVVFAASTPTEDRAVVSLEVASGECTVVRRSSEAAPDPASVSEPTTIEFPTAGGLSAHALYYPPRNAAFEGPEGDLPPLIVASHGGPTGQVFPEYDPEIQFWTTRGFGVVDVNYGGSTGYGRRYRQRLNGQWGVVDTQDCIAAARHLAGQGEVDGERLAIHGGSAGGYTTLCALVFHDDFTAGASYYGVADAEALAQDTHKFESRYLDRLIGPYPETAELWRRRSPIHYVDRLNCPVILLQGLEDEVVPPSQAEQMAAALEAKGIPYAYLAFEGEQHGFRKAENIERATEAELYFYGRIFGFEPADEIEPVDIHGL